MSVFMYFLDLSMRKLLFLGVIESLLRGPLSVCAQLIFCRKGRILILAARVKNLHSVIYCINFVLYYSSGNRIMGKNVHKI